MVQRGWWQRRVEQGWQSRSVVWLMGVRRAGKTMLAKTMPDVHYLDCELPSTRRLLDDVRFVPLNGLPQALALPGS